MGEGGGTGDIFLQRFMHGFFPDGENFLEWSSDSIYILGGCQECEAIIKSSGLTVVDLHVGNVVAHTVGSSCHVGTPGSTPS